jgi:DNA replication protein DnaC/transposase InsO family protein
VRRARKQTPGDLALRFEGVPGEFLQIDWGEVRTMAFTKPELEGQTRYFFAARLKYSRFMCVSFHTDMREETLLRCLIACFTTIGGVPWVVVTDNMKTAVLGRNALHEPVWNPAYQKLAVECKFHPEACAPASGNQKGAVENLVKFVKVNFIAGRTFHDDADLAEQCTEWLSHVNTERPSDATGQEPVVRLVEEQATFSALPATAQDYGFFDCVVVSREGLVAIETNRYSVPAHLIGRALTARIHATRIELFSDHELVATHVRSREQYARIITASHFEAAFSSKPRGRVMVYRDWLCDLARQENQLRRKMQTAGFPYAATIDQFDFTLRPELKRTVMLRFFDSSFIATASSLLLIGASGLGKTHLAVALGTKMVQLGYTVRFVMAQHIANAVLTATTRSEITRLIAPLVKCDLLILDEFGYLSMEPQVGPVLYEIISGRYQKGATVITSNKSLASWGELVGDTALMMAIIDRLLHQGEVFYLRGSSYRMRGKEPVTLNAKGEGFLSAEKV